jgi:hypothetical protein
MLGQACPDCWDVTPPKMTFDLPPNSGSPSTGVLNSTRPPLVGNSSYIWGRAAVIRTRRQISGTVVLLSAETFGGRK